MTTRTPRPGRLRRPLSALAATAALTATVLAAPTGSATAADPQRPAADRAASPTSEKVAARQALTRVERIFAGREKRPNPTMALRDLWLAQDALPADDRAAAERLLARPTDGDPEPDWAPKYGAAPAASSCGDNVCVHWVETGPHRVTAAGGGDGDVATVPTYVQQTLAELDHLADAYVDAGYRPVKPDGGLGGNPKPDVYLANVGPDGMYGYCTSDAPDEQGVFDVWAFCVLDNDYSPEEFGNANTPLENMQVTAAHEYFHAVQFGYDAAEDGWLMEATAAWVEDELYDDVDDNLQYLTTGPLSHPDGSLDYYEDGGLFHYGTWLFFRFLSEKYTDEVGGLPDVVLDIWDRADAAPGSKHGDQISIDAVAGAIRSRGWNLAEAFTAFSVANRSPHHFYDEAVANDYPTSPLGSFRRSGKWSATTLDHLTSATGFATPLKGQRKAKVVVDMPPRSRGSMAAAAVHWKNGDVAWRLVPLKANGNGSVVLPANKRVRRIEVTLVNASTRINPDSCWQGYPFSCGGMSRDDRLTGKARVVPMR